MGENLRYLAEMCYNELEIQYFTKNIYFMFSLSKVIMHYM